MTDIICINAHKAAYMLLDAGIEEQDVKLALNTIKQPANGYYAATDIGNYIRQVQNDR